MEIKMEEKEREKGREREREGGWVEIEKRKIERGRRVDFFSDGDSLDLTKEWKRKGRRD